MASMSSAPPAASTAGYGASPTANVVGGTVATPGQDAKQPLPVNANGTSEEGLAKPKQPHGM
jgi:hypothetical protein